MKRGSAGTSLSAVLTGIAMLVSAVCDAQITWRRTYGGFGSDEARCVRQTADGGYIVAGSTGSFGAGSGDIYVIKLDAYGDPMWSRTYGGVGVDQGIACRELPDGFVVAGSTSLGENGGYDMVLIRTDPIGQPIWQKQYGTPDWDICNAMDVQADGYLLGGISYGLGYPAGAAYTIKTDLNGDTLWTRTWGGAYRIECRGLTTTGDQGFAMAGRMSNATGLDDGFVSKYDSSGQEEWTTVVGGDSLCFLNSVVQAPSGRFAAIGGTRAFNPFQQVYLVGFDSAGTQIWERDIGILSDAGGTEVRNNNYGGFVFTGFNTLNLGELDMILTIADSAGDFQHGFNYGDGLPADGYSCDPTDDGGYVVAGWGEGTGPGLRSMYIVKTDSLVLTASLDVAPFLDPLRIVEPEALKAPLVFANPAQDEVLFIEWKRSTASELLVIDVNGRVLQRRTLYPGINEVPVHALAPGLYNLAISVNTMLVGCEKFVKR